VYLNEKLKIYLAEYIEHFGEILVEHVCIVCVKKSALVKGTI
jgi:hypothetical protein